MYATNNGTMTIAINHDVLTGAYEYYDKWDNKYHEFRDINVFYIYGKTSDGIHFKVASGWPGDDRKITGNIDFSEGYRKLTITLTDEPYGYDAIDFTQKAPENMFSLVSSSTFSEVRLIKSNKAPLYDNAGSAFILRKGYLVKGDIITILDHQAGYYKVSYHSPASDKTSMYWIKDDTLYQSDPGLWK